jgi:beta-glucosidase
VGSSSRDLAVTETIKIDAPSIAPPLDADSTLQEWLASSPGRSMLGRLASPLFQDTELIKVIGTMPMRTLANFGMGMAHQKLDELLAQLRGGPN